MDAVITRDDLWSPLFIDLNFGGELLLSIRKLTSMKNVIHPCVRFLGQVSK